MPYWGAFWDDDYWGDYWASGIGEDPEPDEEPEAAGVDPQITMRYSDDGGKTWSNTFSRSMGRMGEYSARIYWNRLGTGRDRVFEFTGSDAVKVVLTGASFDAEILDS